ncbi:Deoxyribonuclease-2 [Sarcoptes scabiei]|uniref:Deoxyribonuclease-2 n=1 Tax=Sarcoptes scabiei TaxID=52283 RepID=A0A834R3F9_SARSC|nr:Deoxyribonuclease-2 [Sarcoptes scabiei]
MRLLNLITFLIFGFGSNLIWCETNSSPCCKDEDGNCVDWFILYKYPHLAHETESNLFYGYSYAFVTSKSQDSWTLSNKTMKDSDSILGKTLEVFLLMEIDSLRCFTMINPFAIWLIHSIPRFISTTEKGYSYKTNGRRYGQVAMCLSLSVAELAKVVAKNLLVARPYVYSINIEDGNSDLGKALKVLKRHKYSKITQSYLKITTLGGEQFHSYYKSPNYRVDLYADIVAKSTQTSLRVESWRHPLSRSLKSECDSPRTEVENIEKISLSFGNTDLTGTFESSQDHSKWVVSRLEREDMVCVGDINRAPSQFHRGGGTTCMMNDNIWKKFNSLVSEIERCPDDQDPELKTKKSTALDFFKEKWTN